MIQEVREKEKSQRTLPSSKCKDSAESSAQCRGDLKAGVATERVANSARAESSAEEHLQGARFLQEIKGWEGILGRQDPLHPDSRFTLSSAIQINDRHPIPWMKC